MKNREHFPLIVWKQQYVVAEQHLIKNHPKTVWKLSSYPALHDVSRMAPFPLLTWFTIIAHKKRVVCATTDKQLSWISVCSWIMLKSSMMEKDSDFSTSETCKWNKYKKNQWCGKRQEVVIWGKKNRQLLSKHKMTKTWKENGYPAKKWSSAEM